jgi:exopolyphosphatase / guanosine-5'-triphosphate,3'-diphosphate pyrophosphatase
VTRRYAAIDVGTNSVKLHLAERDDGAWRALADRVVVTRLGEGVAETGRLGQEPIRRTVAAISELADEARRQGAEAIVAVGTAGLRQAANADQLLEAARAQAGVEVDVISGEEEARLSFLAATSVLDVRDGRLGVFEVGGGSSQFTFGEERFSLALGAVAVTERFGLDRAVDETTIAAAREAIAGELDALDGRPPLDVLVGIGGNVTTLASVELGLEPYEPERVRAFELAAAEVARQLELYRTKDAEARRPIRGLQPERAEVILAGACIVRTVLAKLDRDSLTVSDQGLRHGVLLDRFGP